ncbi:MAG: hypothetical protein JXB50_05945 [Spirochaetes bacterium]|nr:hypothetical protein [Spirochaetota bacterium]
MTIEETIIKSKYIIKIFGPLSNKNWLEEEVNTWINENKIDILQLNMAYSDDKYILTILYKENIV